jgi:hypothetical protein
VGTNACWIQIRVTRKAPRQRVVECIRAYWKAQGAQLGPPRWRELEPLSLAETHSLGIAISPADGDWITVSDSQRYEADYGLAQGLRESLGVRVRFFGTWDASNHETDLYLGAPTPRAPWPAEEYQDARELADWTFLSFDHVPEGRYDRGPQPLSPTGGVPTAPVRGPLGMKSKEHEAYAILSSASEPSLGAPVPAKASMVQALMQLAEAGEGKLCVLNGEIWHPDPDCWDDEDGEPSSLDDDVVVDRATLVEFFSREEVYEAWLQALSFTADPARIARQIADADPSRWAAALDAWRGFAGSVAADTLSELRRRR